MVKGVVASASKGTGKSATTRMPQTPGKRGSKSASSQQVASDAEHGSNPIGPADGDTTGHFSYLYRQARRAADVA